MKRNLANWDRALRGLFGIALLGGSVLAPLSLVVRIFALGAGGAYMLETSLVGTCLGYRLLGRSTCPADLKKGAP